MLTASIVSAMSCVTKLTINDDDDELELDSSLKENVTILGDAKLK